MADAQNGKWETFMKTGRIQDYLLYKGYESSIGAVLPPQTANDSFNTLRGQIDGGTAQRIDNTRQ